MLAMMMEDEEEYEINAHRERSSEMGCWLCLWRHLRIRLTLSE
jgi:hypothetical protein